MFTSEHAIKLSEEGATFLTFHRKGKIFVSFLEARIYKKKDQERRHVIVQGNGATFEEALENYTKKINDNELIIDLYEKALDTGYKTSSYQINQSLIGEVSFETLLA